MGVKGEEVNWWVMGGTWRFLLSFRYVNNSCQTKDTSDNAFPLLPTMRKPIDWSTFPFCVTRVSKLATIIFGDCLESPWYTFVLACQRGCWYVYPLARDAAAASLGLSNESRGGTGLEIVRNLHAVRCATYDTKRLIVWSSGVISSIERWTARLGDCKHARRGMKLHAIALSHFMVFIFHSPSLIMHSVFLPCVVLSSTCRIFILINRPLSCSHCGGLQTMVAVGHGLGISKHAIVECLIFAYGRFEY